jgi:hydroxymethylpyrimidine/phosphomethylpyrimidine kinase
MPKGSDKAPCVLAIAGLDPSGGAGILADAEAIRAAGARPLCVAAALTVQTTARATRFEAVDARLVRDSVQALLGEENIRAIKLGMLGSEAVARMLLEILPRAIPRVVDPVLRASSGALLFEGDPQLFVQLAEGQLLTPNVFEMQILGPSQLPEAILYKGGDRDGDEVVDVLETREGTEFFRAPRIPGTKRGTGCRLSSFIAARLALGDDPRTAIGKAREFVRAYLEREPERPAGT